MNASCSARNFATHAGCIRSRYELVAARLRLFRQQGLHVRLQAAKARAHACVYNGTNKQQAERHGEHEQDLGAFGIFPLGDWLLLTSHLHEADRVGSALDVRHDYVRFRLAARAVAFYPKL